MNIEDIKKEILNNDAILVYFSTQNCGVCKVLQPKINAIFQENFPKMKILSIKSNEHPEIASHFHIFTAPSILVFFDGKETKREIRHISIEKLVQTTKRTYDLFFEERS